MSSIFSPRPSQPIPVNIIISDSTSLSSAINLSGYTLTMIYIPSTWNTANLSFQVSNDGVNFFNLYTSAGDEYVVDVAASQAVIISPPDFAAITWIKVRSGTSGSSVNQTGDQVLTLMIADI